MQHPDPTAASAPERRPWILLFVAVCLVAANLRMTITGVGPLLDEIAADLGVSVATLGALGSIPLLTWALISPLAHAVSARLGMERAISWSLLVLALGTVWRSLPGAPLNLWIGTVIIGAGLAIGNVLLPAVIKQDFPTRLPLVMGAYTALLSGTASLSAGLAVPVSDISTASGTLGWRVALLLSGIAIPFGAGIWIWATRKRRPVDRNAATGTGSAAAAPPATSRVRDATRSGRRIWTDAVAWLVAGYMGFQSLVFYVVATWLAPYLTSIGYTPAAAGFALMAFQALGLAGSMLVPALLRGRTARWIPALLPLLGFIAWLGMILAPSFMPVWITIGGLVTGAQLTVSVTLMAVRAHTSEAATALSGMSQSVGYLIAAAGPVLFGLLHGIAGDWLLSFALLWVVAVVQIAIGVAVGRPRFVLDR